MTRHRKKLGATRTSPIRGSPLPGRVAAGHRPWPFVQVQLARQACTLYFTHNESLSWRPDLYLGAHWEDSFPFSALLSTFPSPPFSVFRLEYSPIIYSYGN